MKRNHLLIMLVLATSTVSADIVSPSHQCTEPVLDNAGDDYSQGIRKLQIEDYKSCIEFFVSEQDTAIENHRLAAQKAVDEWNNYVEKVSK